MIDKLVLARLERRIARRDRIIAGQKRRIAELEHRLAAREPAQLKAVIERVLSNMRMIPVYGLGKEGRIVEVRAAEPKGETK